MFLSKMNLTDTPGQSSVSTTNTYFHLEPEPRRWCHQHGLVLRREENLAAGYRSGSGRNWDVILIHAQEFVLPINAARTPDYCHGSLIGFTMRKAKNSWRNCDIYILKIRGGPLKSIINFSILLIIKNV